MFGVRLQFLAQRSAARQPKIRKLVSMGLPGNVLIQVGGGPPDHPSRTSGNNGGMGSDSVGILHPTTAATVSSDPSSLVLFVALNAFD